MPLLRTLEPGILAGRTRRAYEETGCARVRVAAKAKIRRAAASDAEAVTTVTPDGIREVHRTGIAARPAPMNGGYRTLLPGNTDNEIAPTARTAAKADHHRNPCAAGLPEREAVQRDGAPTSSRA